MSDRLLVLGGGVSYVDNIRSAQQAGYEVVATDQNGEAPGLSFADYSEVVDITDIGRTVQVAREYDVNGVVPMNDYGVPTAAAVADELDLIGIDRAVAETCTDKVAMREAWDEADVPQPEFGMARSEPEARELVHRIGFPVVMKPANSTGGGSRGVSMVTDESDVQSAFEFARSVYDDDRVLIEECISGSEHSIEVVARDGDFTVVAVSDKEKTPPPYRVDKSVIYPTVSPERGALERVASRAAKALGIDVGAAHVELALTEAGPKIFELGARVGGGATANPIVPAVTGVDYFAQVARLHAGEKDLSFEPTRQDGVTYRFLTPSAGKVTEVRGIEEVSEWNGILDVRLWVSPGDEIPQVQVGSDRSGSVISHAETRNDAYELADQAEAHIEFTYESE